MEITTGEAVPPFVSRLKPPTPKMLCALPDSLIRIVIAAEI